MKTSSLFYRYKEILLGVLMLALALFYLHYSTLIRVRSTVKVSAKLIPEILGATVLVLGVLQIIAGIRYLAKIRADNRANNVPSSFMNEQERHSVLPVFLTFVLIVGYAVVFEWLGFVISSTLCMFFQMLLLSPRSRSRPVYFFIISLVSAVIIYVAFRRGLDLSLPLGLLEGLPL